MVWLERPILGYFNACRSSEEDHIHITKKEENISSNSR